MNQNILQILAAVSGSGVLGTIFLKYFRPNATPLEMLAEVKKERLDDRTIIDDLQSDMRILTDYVHQLRQHIAEGKQPPPPAWPEGLKS